MSRTFGGPRRLVLGASVVGLCVGPGQFAFGSLGLFIGPLGTEFGWSRSGVSLALTFFTLTLAISMPIVGKLVDQHGSRPVAIFSVGVFAILLGSVGALVNELWHLILLFVLIGCLAAGANNLPYMRAISGWYDKRRGLAIGIAMAGSGIGFALVPPLVQFVIDSQGWRYGYYLLAAILVFVALPVLLFFFHDSTRVGRPKVREESPAVLGTSSRVAFRSVQFWQLFSAFFLLSVSLYGLLPHIVPMLTDGGMASMRAAFIASLIGYTIIVARVVVGYAMDRFFAPRVAALIFVFSSAGLISLSGSPGTWQGVVGVVLVGFSIGAEIDLMAFLATRYFGLLNYGVIYGTLFVSMLLGTSIGPLGYGLVFDNTGSYLPALLGGSVLCLFASLLVGMLPAYPAQTGEGGVVSPTAESATDEVQ